MSSNVDKIRMRIFRIWFVTLMCIIGVFADKILGLRNGLSHPFAITFQSLQMLLGLVTPQIGVMVAFYLNLDKQKDKIESISPAQVEVITWMSVFYHVVFIGSLILGVSFYRFDETPDGDGLTKNTAAIVSIMGLLSLLLTPIAFLFAKPDERTSKGGRGRSHAS